MVKVTAPGNKDVELLLMYNNQCVTELLFLCIQLLRQPCAQYLGFTLHARRRGGEPILGADGEVEPIASYGPMVMNTNAEIMDAMRWAAQEQRKFYSR